MAKQRTARQPPIERVPPAKTAEEFLGLLSPTHGGWNDAPRDWIYRGIAHSAWELIPTALRQSPRPILDYTTKTPVVPQNHEQQVDAEYRLLWEFFRVADGQGLLIPEDSQIYRSPWANQTIAAKLSAAKGGTGPWPFDELVSLAALAQHHGIPTRLLDWSNDSLSAAYFAASGAALHLDRMRSGKCYSCGSKPGAGPKCGQCDADIGGASEDTLHLGVWCLNWRYVWGRWPGSTPDKIQVLLVMAPRATNPNMHAQGGVFTVSLVKPKGRRSSIDHEALDQLIQRTARPIPDAAFPVMRLITLPLKEAARLLRLLAMHNLHGASIYPGFDGVVRHLKELRLWDNPPPAGDLPIH